MKARQLFVARFAPLSVVAIAAALWCVGCGGGDGDEGPPSDGSGSDAATGDATEGEDDTGEGATPDSETPGQDAGDFEVVEIEFPDAGNWSPANNASAYVDGDLLQFTSLCRGQFVPDPESPGGPGTLQVIMAVGVRQIEVRLDPVAAGWMGTSSHTSGSPGAVVTFNDGTISAEQAQFKYLATAWDVQITENTGPAGRIVGTFSATMALQAGGGPNPMFITNGSFDCAYP